MATGTTPLDPTPASTSAPTSGATVPPGRTAAAAEAARDAWRLLTTLLFEGEAHDRTHEICRSLDMPPGVLKGLVHIVPDEGVPLRDLAGHFGCDASYITSLADDLEERGLARRRPHPTDRRVKVLTLTARGTRVRQQALDQLHEPPAAMSALTPAQQRTLRDLLQKMVDADTRLSGGACGPVVRSADRPAR